MDCAGTHTLSLRVPIDNLRASFVCPCNGERKGRTHQHGQRHRARQDHTGASHRSDSAGERHQSRNRHRYRWQLFDRCAPQCHAHILLHWIYATRGKSREQS